MGIKGKKGGKISPETEFKPGQSGNPNGRPKKLPSLDRLLPEVLGDEIQEDSKIKQILDKLVDQAIKKGDVRAAQILLDRGYGAPKQTITNDGEITITVRHES